MKSVCHASFSTIRKFVRDILGVTVSRSYLKKIVGKVSDALAGPYGELEKALPFQCIINIDESTVPDSACFLGGKEPLALDFRDEIIFVIQN